LTQHLPATSRLKSHEYFFDVPFGYANHNMRHQLAQVSLLGANFANFRGFSAREAA
jgi:hypothetical protein